MIYQEPGPGDRKSLERALESDDTGSICRAMVALALDEEEDWSWLQFKFLELLKHSEPGVRAIAATCLGHVGRIHQNLDLEIVVPALQKLLDDPETSGYAEDAFSDIKTFMPKSKNGMLYQKWFIIMFDKQGYDLISETGIEGVDWCLLRKLLHIEDELPSDDYILSNNQVKRLSGLLAGRIEIDHELYEYQLFLSAEFADLTDESRTLENISSGHNDLVHRNESRFNEKAKRRVTWNISAFDKCSERLVAGSDIEDVDWCLLRRLLRIEDELPSRAYLLSPWQVGRLVGLMMTPFEIDHEVCRYFLRPVAGSWPCDVDGSPDPSSRLGEGESRVWKINMFEKNGDDPVDEADLEDADWCLLRGLLQFEEEIPMVHTQLTENQLRRASGLLAKPLEIDHDSYDYVLTVTYWPGMIDD